MKINNKFLVILFIFAIAIIIGVGSTSASDVADAKYVKDSGLTFDLSDILDGLSSDIVFSGAKLKYSPGPGKIPGGCIPRR
ncbi:MAG: hypothetical protein E7Z80_07045 [Methanobrevibacter thaueri]|nr:hypothetical protein [Methanobrevibacter thaueri]